MIGEAIDTALTLGWALAVWIVLTSAAAALALYTVLVTAWCLVRVTVTAAMGARRLLRGRVSASQTLRAIPEPRAPHAASDARTGPQAPSWAHTDKDAT